MARGRQSNSILMMFVRSTARSPPRSLSAPLCPPPESSRPHGRNGDALRSPVLRLPECRGVIGGTWTAIELPLDAVREVHRAEHTPLAEHTALNSARVVQQSGWAFPLSKHILPAIAMASRPKWQCAAVTCTSAPVVMRRRRGLLDGHELHLDDALEVVRAEHATLAERTAVHSSRIVPADGLGVFPLEELPALDVGGQGAAESCRSPRPQCAESSRWSRW